MPWAVDIFAKVVPKGRKKDIILFLESPFRGNDGDANVTCYYYLVFRLSVSAGITF